MIVCAVLGRAFLALELGWGRNTILLLSSPLWDAITRGIGCTPIPAKANVQACCLAPLSRKRLWRARWRARGERCCTDLPPPLSSPPAHALWAPPWDTSPPPNLARPPTSPALPAPPPRPTPHSPSSGQRNHLSLPKYLRIACTRTQETRGERPVWPPGHPGVTPGSVPTRTAIPPTSRERRRQGKRPTSST